MLSAAQAETRAGPPRLNRSGGLQNHFCLARKKITALCIFRMTMSRKPHNGDAPGIFHCRVDLYPRIKERHLLNRADNLCIPPKIFSLKFFVTLAPRRRSRRTDAGKQVRQSDKLIC